MADTAGNYRIERVPAGTYEICIQAVGFLTTCEWEQWGRATVAEGALLDSGRRTLTRAAIVTIRIEDPRDLLGPAGQISTPLVAVRDPFHRIHSARKVATENKTHIFHVEAPYETPLALRLHSARFRLADALGRPLDPVGVDVPFQIGRGAAAPVFTFVVAAETAPIQWPPPLPVPPPGTASSATSMLAQE